MKVEIEMKIVDSVLMVDTHLDGEQVSPYYLSRKLTGTYTEDGVGIFCGGEIEYIRKDGTKKVFSQPEPLENCTPAILKARIQAVSAWVHENDGEKKITFEV